MEICFEPFSLAEGLRKSAQEPPATLLVLPNGWVKVAAALPEVCADLRRCSLDDAWRAYQRAWREAVNSSNPCAKPWPTNRAIAWRTAGSP
jgi:hypothetical protein